MSGKYYALDTNIILDDAHHLYTVSNGESIILPETVLDEIDAKKSGFEEINFQAREFARLLEDSEKLGTSLQTEELTVTTFKLTNSNISLHIVSLKSYPDFHDTDPAIINDRKILHSIQQFKAEMNIEVVFLSLDVMCRVRADSIGIQGSSIVIEEQTELQYHKTFQIDIIPPNLNGKNILELDPDYKSCNYSYTIEETSTGRQQLAQIQNGHIVYVPERAFNSMRIKPLNKEQKFFANAMLQQYAGIYVVDAKAGSGKTLLAVSTAMRLIDKKEYAKIIYIRNSIESLDKGEDVGYLPGLEDKFKIYNHPLMDTLDFIARQDLKKSKANKTASAEEESVASKIAQYQSKYQIETMWVGEMRGRTLSNAFIIVDEAQNMSNKTMQLVLSRIDSSCMVTVVGSNLQIDNFYVNKHTNALSTLLAATTEEHDEVALWAGELNKVQRGPITAWAEKILGNKK
jgi:PhoH-like ATPase